MPAFKRFKLKNGLEVILAEFHDLPLVDVSLVIKAGGGANPPELAGLAEMTANMLDEGTKTRSALDIADEMAVLGANLGDRQLVGRVERVDVGADQEPGRGAGASGPTWSSTRRSPSRSSRACATTC